MVDLLQIITDDNWYAQYMSRDGIVFQHDLKIARGLLSILIPDDVKCQVGVKFSLVWIS